MVLFTSDRPLNRAENIKAVFEAYDGEKQFIQTDPYRYNPEIDSSKYKLRITDDFPHSSHAKCILIQHGISGGKLVGLDQPRPYFRRENIHLLSYVIATGEDMKMLVAKQSGVPIERVKAFGMPRTDSYFGKQKGDGGTFLAKTKAYLYAPTFRNVKETPLPDIDWEKIDNLLLDSEVLVVKPHMVTKHILKNRYRHIIEVSAGEPSAPYIMDCDVLITDYSSIMFDAYLLDKPVVLFEKEKGYTQTRGMYLKYPDEYSSRYCTDEESLINEIRNANGLQDADIKCREKVASACDGHSTERIISLIKSML